MYKIKSGKKNHILNKYPTPYNAYKYTYKYTHNIYKYAERRIATKQ